MPRQLPWDEIPDTNVVPGGLYPLKAVSLEEVRSKEMNKLMYKMSAQVMDEPRVADFSGMMIWEQFVIGSDDDPDANELNTWKKSFGARMLKQMINASQIPERADMDKICANFMDHQFIGNISYSVDNNPDSEYKGRPQNRMTAFYKMGEREVGIDPKSYAEYKGEGASGVIAPAGPVPVAPAAPSHIASHIAAAALGAPAVTAPLPPTVVTPAQPAVGVPVQTTIPGQPTYVGDPVTPAGPQPVVPTSPVAPIPPGTPPAQEVIAGATINCPTCQQQGKPSAIPLADFSTHVGLHQTGQI